MHGNVSVSLAVAVTSTFVVLKLFLDTDIHVSDIYWRSYNGGNGPGSLSRSHDGKDCHFLK